MKHKHFSQEVLKIGEIVLCDLCNEDYSNSTESGNQGRTMKNPNCDNDRCKAENGEVRVLPTGGNGNAILCRACFEHEIRWRRERNRQLSVDCRFALPTWETLKVYE